MTWSNAANHLMQILEAGEAAGWSRARIEAAIDEAIAANGYTEAQLCDARNAVQSEIR
ncbi:hypothetical protein ACWGVR_14275 [Streptomyces xanthophaeus]